MPSGSRRGWFTFGASPPPVGGWSHSCSSFTDPWSGRSRLGSIVPLCTSGFRSIGLTCRGSKPEK
eukprot:11032371-Alexandrium_andersonii.AAC.1